jgi:hypothetical protein
MNKDELAQLIVQETELTLPEAYEMLDSEDPGVKRMINSILSAVEERGEFRETMARHRLRLRSAVS